MRKLLLFICSSLLLICFSPSIKAAGGATCEQAVTIVADTHHCVFENSSSSQWFKIHIPANKEFTITNCGMTNVSTSLYLYQDCSSSIFLYSDYCDDSDQKIITSFAEFDTTYYIRWGANSATEFDFIFQVTDPAPGKYINNAITVNEGIINTILDANKTMYYKFTPTFDCKINIKDLSENYYTYMYVYDNKEMDHYLTSAGYPFDNWFQARKGVTYYFQMYSYTSISKVVTWSFSVVASPAIAGTDCEHPKEIVTGLNRVNNDNVKLQWFKYKAAERGILSASTCGLTEFETYLNVKESCGYSSIAETKKCGNQLSMSHLLEKGDSIYLVWSSNDNTAVYDFDFKFTPVASVPGCVSENALVAVAGNNKVTNISTDLWYKIVAPSRSLMHISTCDLTYESTNISLYKGYPRYSWNYVANSYNDCKNQSDIFYKVQKGDTMYIKLNNNEVYNPYSFLIEFKSLRNGAEIIDYEVSTSSYSNVNTVVTKTINSTNKTINIVVLKNVSSLSSLYTNFKISEGARLINASNNNVMYEWINTNYTSPLSIKVISEDSVTINTWTVTVTKAIASSSEKKFLKYNCNLQTDAVIDTTNHTITVHLNKADVESQYTTFTVSAGAIVKDSLGFTMNNGVYLNYEKRIKLNVIAENGSTQVWFVYTNANPNPKGYDCDNPLDAVLGTNVRTSSNYYEYYRFVPSKSGCFSIKGNSISSIAVYMYEETDCSYSGYSYQNIDAGDSITFLRDTGDTLILEIGNSNYYPWTLYSLPVGTETDFIEVTSTYAKSVIIDKVFHKVNMTVSANAEVNYFELNYKLSAGAVLLKAGELISSGDDHNFTNALTFTVKAQNGTTQDWVISLKKEAANTEKDFVSFSIIGQTGPAIIDAATGTVKIGVADSVSLTDLTPYFVASENAQVRKSNVIQYSGQNAINFTNPVAYTITAQDNTIKAWTVTVVKGVIKNHQANVIAFHLSDEAYTPAIDTTNRLITVPFSGSTDGLVASFTLSPGAIAKIGSVIQVSGVSANNYSTDVIYAITSEDGNNTKNWTVKLVRLSNEAKILTFVCYGNDGVINESNKTITVNLPADLNITLTNIIPQFTISNGAVLKVNGIKQENGVTMNNFTQPLTYVVISEDGKVSNSYTVTVTKPVGIKFNSISADIYPVPAKDYLNIELDAISGNTKVELINMLGVVVLSKSIASENNSFRLDIGNLKQGAYFIRLINNNNVLTRKIAIAK